MSESDLNSPAGPGDPRLRDIVEAALFGDQTPQAKIGRFTLLDRLGAGGMGTVWAAYDPELDRKVAVKVLHTGRDDETVRQRIVREAQAMAKLSHPNVAQVYEVGEHGGETFIAMEFVRGETLRTWQADEGRAWRSILDVYIQAGRGLSAAHDAGLVHRDFKPDNAIVAADGRPRVLDFGLARTDELVLGNMDTQLDTMPSPEVDALATPLTRTGAVMGTPAYMAPEQLLGRSADAKADQFAFCVALWEALHGERPHAGARRIELVENVTEGNIREAPKGTVVPTWIRTVLRRGLQTEPKQRYASLADLLAALERDPTRRRRRIALGLAAGALVVGAVVGQRVLHARTVAGCDAEGEAIAEVWNDEARAGVREGLVATGLSYAPQTADRVMPWIDDAANAWTSARTEVCMHTEVERTMAPDEQARALWCLDEHRQQITVLVESLSGADEARLERAVKEAAALASPARCVDERMLATLPPAPPDGLRTEARQVADELVRIAAMDTADAPEQRAAALAQADKTLERAKALQWPPLVARAQVLHAQIARQSDAEGARKTLTEAYTDAAKSGYWDVAADAALGLIALAGVAGVDAAVGQEWGRHAEVALALAGDANGERECERLANLAWIFSIVGDRAGARPYRARALELREQVYGPEHPVVGNALINLATTYNQEDPKRARAMYERAAELWAATQGPDHPDIAVAIENIAILDRSAGAYDDAAAAFERALAIRERSLPPTHYRTTGTISQIAVLRLMQGRYDDAQRESERLLALRLEALGPAHPGVADAQITTARTFEARGQWQRARELATEALAIWEKGVGAEHPGTTAPLAILARAHVSAGECDEAKTIADRIMRINDAKLGPDNANGTEALWVLGDVAKARQDMPAALEHHAKAVELALTHNGAQSLVAAKAHGLLARTQLDAGQDDAAMESFGKALAIFDARSGNQQFESDTRWAYARALAKAGRVEEARSQVDLARADLVAAGPGRAGDLAELDAWSASLPA